MTAPELIEILSAMLEDGSILPHENLRIGVPSGELDDDIFKLERVTASRFGATLVGDEI